MATFNEVIALLIRADTGGAVGPLKNLEGQAARTASAWDKAGKKIGVSGAALKSGLAGMVAGLSIDAIGRGILDAADKYAAAAKSADDLANATGATIEEVSRLQAALVDSGVSAEQSAGLLTKFATAAGTKKGADTLRALNVEMVRGQSGAVDYAATMTAAVDAIMTMGDAAQRNTAFVALFGRAGAKAFQDMMNAGMSLSDAMAAVASGRVFTAEDAANAKKYDDAMDSLNASMEELTNIIGRGVVPALAQAADGLSVLLGLIDGADPQILAGGLNPLVAVLGLLSDLFGKSAGGARELHRRSEEAGGGMKTLTELIASGVTSGQAFADAVAEAGDELAQQDANARLAAQALDLYRGSTDQAYESTLKLLGLDAGERSAQRAAEGAVDASQDAKANLDEALKTARAAKTVVEHITAIQGRARKKREEEGIVAGSIDVSAEAGVKGRKGGTRTRVTEAAGVITDAEARKIRQAARQYEQSLDDISEAWIRLGQARVEHKEALGVTLTEAEKLDEVRRALKEGLNVPGLSPEAKKDIKADLKVVEEQIKALGGVPIEIDGIKFKGGTTKAQVDKLKADINAAMARGDFNLGHALKGQLDKLIEKGGTDLNVTLGLDPASVAKSKADLENLGINPKTGKPYNTKTTVTADTKKAKNDLDALTQPRTVTVTVDLVPGTDGFGGNSPLIPLNPQTARNRVNFGGGRPPVQFNPTIINNYPKPERASDSVAASLRTAKYLVGV